VRFAMQLRERCKPVRPATLSRNRPQTVTSVAYVVVVAADAPRPGSRAKRMFSAYHNFAHINLLGAFE
jgi:hypothetical protein